MLDTDDIGSNNSSNAHIEDLIATRISRRNLLTGAAALAAAGLVPGALLSSAPAAANSSRVRKLRFEAHALIGVSEQCDEFRCGATLETGRE